ncbi:MAG: dihydrodipicolinate synthase family protein [Desulfobacterales bacterium]|nr:dihydrodipicolinate synthase family protein [Desulfobacterales bacterium]
MTKISLDGVFPPIPTTFEDGKVAHDALAENVKKWSRTGIRGMLVLGSNGEYVYLSDEEKKQVVKTVVDAAGEDQVILVGSGCESTVETIRLTRACADLGAHAALVVTPSYYGGKMTPPALIHHYERIADQSPIPILLYNVPKFTHVNLTADTVKALSSHANIIGLKDSRGAVGQLGEYLNQVKEDFNVLVGSASAFYSALCLGCAGGILALANVAPEICVEIFRLTAEGRHPEARQLQLKMIPVNKAVTATFGIPGLKAALDMLGYFGGDPRSPLLPVGEAEREEIRQILTTAGLL